MKQETKRRIKLINELNEELIRNGYKGFLKSKLKLKHFYTSDFLHYLKFKNPFNIFLFLHFDYLNDLVKVNNEVKTFDKLMEVFELKGKMNKNKI